jgi:hypothetical protein
MIITGPCDGSIFIRGSKDCTVSTICGQLRFRDSNNIKIYAYCTSDPVVERSTLISFGPFNATFPRLKELFAKANFLGSKLQY